MVWFLRKDLFANQALNYLNALAGHRTTPRAAGRLKVSVDYRGLMCFKFSVFFFAHSVMSG